MAKILQLFNHHRKPIGTATWNKRNSTVSVVYSNAIHFADTTLTFDEFDDYKRRMGVIDEREINQVTLDDLL